MDFEDNYKKLLKQMNVNYEKRSLKHTVGRNTPLFPFKTTSTKVATFTKGFYPILGEFSRLFLNKKLNYNYDLKSLIENIDKNNEECFDVEEGTENYLVKLIEEYLFNEKGNLKILNPYLFLYLPLSEGSQLNAEREIALFLRDIFFINPLNQNLLDFFNSKETNDLIIKLILNNIPNLETEQVSTKYYCLLNNIYHVFNEDMNFITEYKEYLMENIDKIFAYYYFFYISQLVLKLNRGFDDNLEMDNLYYLLDWESVSKNRKTVDKGYNLLKDKSYSLFSQAVLIDQLNTLLGTNGLLKKDLLYYYNDLSVQEKNNFLIYLKKWICCYKWINNFDSFKKNEEDYLEELPNNFKDLVNELYKDINSDVYGIKPRQKYTFSSNLRNVAKRYFLKKRGSYGYVLNMDRDMLLVITTLCVKDKKIKLNQLFKEYERRGLFFDRYSKNEIVKLLNELNLIDKKSDSGDAQYVKPIL